jgi:hypothetical protein
MATTHLNFGAQIDAWVKQSDQRMTAVFRESTQRTVSIAQSIVPVDTGFLRASVRASTSAAPPLSREAPRNSLDAAAEAAYPDNDDGNVTLTIAGANLGQTIFVGYTANYAGHVEYGTSRMAGRAFVGQAVAQWPMTVSRVIEDLKGRAGR